MAGTMRHISPITSKGQVTIPKAIRERLGVSPPDRVEFALNEDGEIVIRPVQFSIKALRGVVPAIPGRDPGDFEELIHEAMEEKAEQVVAELTKP